MKLGNLKNAFVKLGDSVKENDSAIMAALSIGGMIAAVFFTARNARKTREIVEDETLENSEKMKKLVPVVGPTIIAATVSTVSTVGLYKKNQKLGKLLGAAVSTANTMKTLMDETEKATKAVVGEEKAQEITQQVQKNIGEKGTSSSVNPEVYDTGSGKHIYCEKHTGLTIRASKDYIISHLRNINLWIKDQWKAGCPDDDLYISLSDIASELAPNGGANTGTAHRVLGWKLADLKNRELRFNIKETFNYEHTNGDEEPGYYIDIKDPLTLVPDWAVTYK